MSKFISFNFVNFDESLMFGKNQENRNINRSHLSKIKKQCLSNFDVMPPITINSITNNIVDGQHRLKAYQELILDGRLDKNVKIKVMFVEIPMEEEKQAIIDANTNSKNWSLDDYILSYAKQGVESYVKLDEWCKNHSLCSDNGKSKFRYGAAIIKGKRCMTCLKDGLFVLNDDELRKAEEVHVEMQEIIDIFSLNGKGNWVESLAVSWSETREMHPFNVWRKEMKSQTKRKGFMKLPKESSKDWDNIFSQIHLAIDKKKE